MILNFGKFLNKNYLHYGMGVDDMYRSVTFRRDYYKRRTKDTVNISMALNYINRTFKEERKFRMKSIVPTKLCHFWKYVLMALVIFQFVKFAYNKPESFEVPRRYCSNQLANIINKKFGSKDYDLQQKNPILVSSCCSPGCTQSQSSTFRLYKCITCQICYYT